MFIYALCYGYFVNIVNMPFDGGANIRGSNKAFEVIKNDLDFIKNEKTYNLDVKKGDHREIFSKGFMACWNSLNKNNLPLLIGGDHSCAISSIYASNEHALMNNERLGVLWCDAHADFNTIETSPSGNIHGVPVSVLCGHSLPLLSYGKYLSCDQFMYYGIRDLDTMEFQRFQNYNMKFIDYNALVEHQLLELQYWMSQYDKIHLSFDMDCFDPFDFNGVNTPVETGPKKEDILSIVNAVKESNKLKSMDLVEYNPKFGNNTQVIIELLKTVFEFE